MALTFLLFLLMMAGLFLMLLGGVGFIQDKRFFTSAPKKVQEVVLPRDERFPGAHAVGWLMIAASFALMGGAMLWGGWDGIQNSFCFWQFFRRFLTMLLLLKAFDILFFDWFLLCNAGFNFFPHFYPETKEVLGRYLFGYNRKTHLIHILLFPVASAALAWVCTLL